MKIRTDFVTNSSSSSYVFVRIKSEKLLSLMEKYDVRFLDTNTDNTVIYKNEAIEGAFESIDSIEELLDWFIPFLDWADPDCQKEFLSNREQYYEDVSKADYIVNTLYYGEWSDEEEYGDDEVNYSFKYEKPEGDCAGTASITTSDTTNLRIPDGETSIEDEEYREYDNLVSVIIPEGVISIGDEAFAECVNLSSITFPSSITRIGLGAFEGCTNLERVYFPDWKSFLNMDDENENEERTWGEADVYINGEKITDNIVIPESVTRIGDKIFYYWTITSIIIPESVTSIGFCAFFGATGLKSITIPESVVSIGAYAFDECEGLERVYFSDLNSFFDIEFYDFRGEAGYVPGWKGVDYYINGELVKDMVVPDGITNITGIFYGCKSIESITIPASVTTMAEEGFYYCDNLKSIYFSDLDSFLNIDRIPATFGSNLNVDYYIDGKLLTELTIPEGVTKIGKDTFAGCKSLESVTIPDSVTSIGKEAFYACRNLGSITIPASVTKIEEEAFSRCEALESVYFSDLTSMFKMEYQYSGWRDVDYYINGELVTDLNIPDGIINIGDYAFSGCKSLKTVTISSNVERIGIDAFRDCSNLKSITIPDSVTEIGEGWNEAFKGCDDLIIHAHSGSYAEEYAKKNNIPFEAID